LNHEWFIKKPLNPHIFDTNLSKIDKLLEKSNTPIRRSQSKEANPIKLSSKKSFNEYLG
jgi:hypothetical protein